MALAFTTGVYIGLLAGIAFGAWIANRWHADDAAKPETTAARFREYRWQPSRN